MEARATYSRPVRQSLTEKGVQQAWQVAERARTLGITHVITSDLGRTQQTARIIADACGCDVLLEPRLRELDMGVLEKRHIDTLTETEEGWRRTLVNGTEDGRIPEGESMQELSVRMHAALGGMPEAARRKPSTAGESRDCAGMSGQHHSGVTGLCGAPFASAQLLYFPY